MPPKAFLSAPNWLCIWAFRAAEWLEFGLAPGFSPIDSGAYMASTDPEFEGKRPANRIYQN
jgi:hypothetical protein